MTSNEKVRHNKFLKLIKIYNFYFGHFFIRLCYKSNEYKEYQTH